MKDKNVIVTGGGGIGRAICLRFAEEGSVVGIFDINELGANETLEQIEQQGRRAFAYSCDIANYHAVTSAVDQFESDAGQTDVLVNNAGWDQGGPFLTSDPEVWKKIIDINLYGPLNMHHVVVSRMAERSYGKVINIASDAGRVGSSGEAIYSACKGGVIAFSKTLARELARANVQINTICPGPTDTALFHSFAGEGERAEKLKQGLQRAIPMKRLGQPEDYPGLVTFLASDDADYITGQTISVSGGLTMHG
ncbi:MAG: glucose 1-dehydrogenase [Gammaproteobacteria bacterium]|nr:glucose 1-dehydrogenase [Gammaproteobacteria bacterium]